MVRRVLKDNKVPRTREAEALSLPPDFSISCTIFGLQSSYMLEYHWLFALFLRRSARGFTHVLGEVDSTPTYVAAIFL